MIAEEFLKFLDGSDRTEDGMNYLVDNQVLTASTEYYKSIFALFKDFSSCLILEGIPILLPDVTEAVVFLYYSQQTINILSLLEVDFATGAEVFHNLTGVCFVPSEYVEEVTKSQGRTTIRFKDQSAYSVDSDVKLFSVRSDEVDFAFESLLKALATKH